MAQGLVRRCVLCIFWCVLLQLWEDHVAMEGMCGPSRIVLTQWLIRAWRRLQRLHGKDFLR